MHISFHFEIGKRSLIGGEYRKESDKERSLFLARDMVINSPEGSAKLDDLLKDADKISEYLKD